MAQPAVIFVMAALIDQHTSLGHLGSCLNASAPRVFLCLAAIIANSPLLTATHVIVCSSSCPYKYNPLPPTRTIARNRLSSAPRIPFFFWIISLPLCLSDLCCDLRTHYDDEPLDAIS